MTETENAKLDYKINFERIKELVYKYEVRKESGEIKRLSEAGTREDFISPLFKALGWNMENDPGRNDEVNKEENIAGKRSDYSFRINSIPKFFLEAKSLKEEDILFGKGYEKQAVNYAWLKSCSWAILTNFSTLAVYNADSASPVWGFTIYAKDFLSDHGVEKLKLLSKIGFEKGLLDEWASRNGKKPMKRSVGKQLLQDMIHFREILSKDIKMNNPEVSADKIDETVQRILDRLIFIRNAEDRDYEPKDLKSNFTQWAVKEKGHLIRKVRELYQHYRDVYNSGLFGKETDEIHISDQVEISNETLKEVIQGLYSPEGVNYSYDFSILDADVLGSIYEQYLENMLKQTQKRAKLEESKTHRKEQGIYYTPSYIVDYIVKNTIGEYINSHTPEEISNVKILDPACGSGSFLIRAYRELENYWNDYYKKNKQIPKALKNITQSKFELDGNGETLQFYSVKSKILKDNIFGVDLDPKAVEIAQLNLLLQISEMKQKLPTLRDNIKVGNSLIDDPTVSDMAFRWEERFPEIMREGGFDIVIGNPPYFKIFENNPINKTDEYKEIKSGMMNASAVFINRSLKLLKKGGHLGMIVPKMLSFTDSWDKIRHKILTEYKVLYTIDSGKAFKGVLLEQIIFILKNEKPKSDDEISVGELDGRMIKETARVLQNNCAIENKIQLEPNPIAYDIKKKMEVSGKKLGSISEINLGLGIQGKDFFFEEPREGSDKVLRGDDVQRYIIRGCRYYDPNSTEIQEYKKTIEHFKKPHIVAQRIVAHIRDHIKITAALDEEGLFSFNTVTNIFVKDGLYSNEFILALLNSDVIQFYTYKFIYSNAVRSMDFYKAYAQNIPLPKFNLPQQEKVAKLARKLITDYSSYSMNKDKRTDDVNELEREINETQNQINDILYDMYNISKVERSIIKKSLE